MRSTPEFEPFAAVYESGEAQVVSTSFVDYANAGADVSIFAESAAGASVTLDGTGSSDDSGELTLEWDVDGDGEYDDAVGASPERCRVSVPEPETARCVDAFTRGAARAPVPFALGMIYGYESQTPEVAEAKVAGLRGRYGIDGEGVSYFSLHAGLDVQHARELLSAVGGVAPDEGALAAAARGAQAGAQASWGLLSGVARVRDIAC